MRICVIGTSNAIHEDGYAKHLESVATVDRYCIGGAPSLLYALALEKVDFSGFDACILDTCINDELHVERGCFELADIAVHLMRAIEQIPVPTLLLELPSLHRLDKPRPVHLLYKSIARRTGTAELDAYEWLRIRLRHARRMRLSDDPAGWFRDRDHLNKVMSAKLSTLIHDQLLSIGRGDPFACGPAFRLARVPGETVERVTSLRTDVYTILREGDRRVIDLDEGEFIAGFVMNSSTSSGVLRFGGMGKLVSTTNYLQPKRGLAMVLPMVAQPRLGGPVTLELTADGASEMNLISAPVRVPPYLEIAEVIIGRG